MSGTGGHLPGWRIFFARWRSGASGQARATGTAFPCLSRRATLVTRSASRPSMSNRTLRDLRLKGIAEMRAGIVTIHDWERLVKSGQFDPAFMLLDGPAPGIAELAWRLALW